MVTTERGGVAGTDRTIDSFEVDTSWRPTERGDGMLGAYRREHGSRKLQNPRRQLIHICS